MLYATDASNYQVEPVGVVLPASIDDALEALRVCARFGAPVLPRGGGTSLAGQCTSTAVVLDFSASCTRLLELDPDRRRCRVEPGITVDDLNDRIAHSGLFFAPDPATARHANIGGCIGNNAAGSRSIKYGRTSENLLGVDIALASAERMTLNRGAATRDPRVRAITEQVAEIVRTNATLIRERYPRTIRRNAGYNLDLILNQLEQGGTEAINLAHLVAGSEGTLAVTLNAELLLRPRPRARALALLAFDELEEAIDAVAPILATDPSAVELLDDTIIELARANVEYRRYADQLPPAPGGPAKAILYVEYASPLESHAGQAELEHHLDQLRTIAGAQPLKVARDPASMANAWKLRKAGEPLLHGVPGDRKPASFVEDNAVPVEHLAEFVRGFRDIVAKHGTRASYWAHASVGVLHVRPFLNLRDPADIDHMHQMAVEVADLARSLGGVMSGEHGDGRVRGPLLERYYGPELMHAFRAIKRIFDPDNRLNPGNIVDPGPIETISRRTRIHPHDRNTTVLPAHTYYDYRDQHGFGGAIEMCNGAGVCRKKQGGTMCPSYMGTLDERHSTRGRANALRLTLTGQFDQSGNHQGSSPWNNPDTIETLDLCLSCKACKAECPSNVDVARLKAEYTAQRYREQGGPPLGALAMGHIRALNRMGSLTPRLANMVASSATMKRLAEKMLGIDPRRQLPPFATSLARSFPRGDRKPPQAGPQSDELRPAVALFGDCFTMFNEPIVGQSAKRLLEAFGYRVLLADAGCCARAMISNGLLDHARDTIDRTAAKLGPWMEAQGVRALLFAEPSCLSAIADDWQMLHTGASHEAKRRIAERAFLIEDFLEKQWNDHPQRPAFVRSGSDDPEVVLHQHCHQRALLGGESGVGIMTRACASTRVLDAGCCGMAGAFGYSKDRYDLSMRIGERVLLPTARGLGGSGVMVAPGTSCRHQLREGAGVQALHPVEFLEQRLPRSE